MAGRRLLSNGGVPQQSAIMQEDMEGAYAGNEYVAGMEIPGGARRSLTHEDLRALLGFSMPTWAIVTVSAYAAVIFAFTMVTMIFAILGWDVAVDIRDTCALA